MNKLKKIKYLTLFILTGFSPYAFSQKTSIYTDADADFKTGIEQFQKEKFIAAQKSFTKIVESNRDASSLIKTDAEYYNAICAIELFNKDGELFLKQFIKNHPESPKTKTAYFHLGKYNYRKKKYKEAINWFEKVEVYDLTVEELAEFYFKRGYSYFNTEQYELASKDFNEIKDVDNKYNVPAKYYFAHIAYIKKNYETALNEFLKLQKDETFGPVVSYYIVQLYYLQKKYDSVISYAPALLDTINSKRAPEIARVIGESYYNTSKYKESIPYFKQYEAAYKELPREDNYELGYAYYKTQDYTNALNYFVKVTSTEDDSLTQNVAYHMGDCYLKTGNKQKALNAFGKAQKLKFDETIEENALYNYSKLCYELSYNPYNQAIKAFKKYLRKYPTSVHADEAYTYLVNAFTTSQNYKEAIEAIESIKVLTPDLKLAYQKAAYFQGVELFNNSLYDDAIVSFDKSLKYTFDKKIKSDAFYWKAEAYYRNKNYQKAIEVYNNYILELGELETKELGEANYNIGYCYFNLNNFENSNLSFRKFTTFKPLSNAKKINDAYNRIADGYFMKKEYADAVNYYTQSYTMKLVDDDYALFQRGLANGLLKKYDAKISDLQTFIKDYPHSSYIQRARYELAQTFLSNHENDFALSEFLDFIEAYPTSIYVNSCLSKIALVYYNRKDDEKALIYFDKLIKRDRKSPEANEAIELVKAIYKAKGQVQEMDRYLSSIGASIPQASLDSLTYEIAKDNYLERKTKIAIDDFKKYIQNFPDGIFITDAHFYKAESEFATSNIDGALESYMFVIAKNKNEYTEKALYRASSIVYQKQDYSKALEYYTQLEAQAENPKNTDIAKVGIMRCNYKLKKYPEAIDYANKVFEIEKVSNELIYESHFIIGNSMYATEKYDDAMAEFRVVANSTKNDLGAESSYYIAKILQMKGDYKKAEKTIYDLINSDASSPYWITNSLLLLADNYVALKDNFQAKTILNSVLTESDIPELIKVAQEKLTKINADEEAAKLPKIEVAPIQVMFKGDSVEQKELFIKEPVEKPIENKE